MKDIFRQKNYIPQMAEGELTIDVVKKSLASGNIVGIEVHGPDKVVIKILIEKASMEGLYKITISGVPDRETGEGIMTEKEIEELLEKAKGTAK